MEAHFRGTGLDLPQWRGMADIFTTYWNPVSWSSLLWVFIDQPPSTVGFHVEAVSQTTEFTPLFSCLFFFNCYKNGMAFFIFIIRKTSPKFSVQRLYLKNRKGPVRVNRYQVRLGALAHSAQKNPRWPAQKFQSSNVLCSRHFPFRGSV